VPGYGGSGGGTSYAAPHASGLVTLMEKFSDENSGTGLHYSPTLGKAALLASGRHDAGSFDKEGSGTVQAPAADNIFGFDWYVNETYSESNATQTYDFYFSEYDDEVIVALAWLNDPQSSDVNNGSAEPDVDLDLSIDDPDGNFVEGSYNWDRCWELVSFNPSKSGDYTVEVDKYRWDASETYRWMSVAYSRF
jgi:hypothetical protein